MWPTAMSPLLYKNKLSFLLFKWSQLYVIFYIDFRVNLNNLYNWQKWEFLFEWFSVCFRWHNCSDFNSDDTCKDKRDEYTDSLLCCTYDERFVDFSCEVKSELGFVSYNYYQNEMSDVRQAEKHFFLDFRNIINMALIWIIIYNLLVMDLVYLERFVKIVTYTVLGFTTYLILLTFCLPGSTHALSSLRSLQTHQNVTLNKYGDAYIHMFNSYELATSCIVLYSVWTKETRNIVTDALFMFVFRLIMAIVYLIWAIAMLGIVTNKYNVTDYDCYRSMIFSFNGYPLLTEMLGMTPSPRLHMTIFFLLYCLIQVRIPHLSKYTVWSETCFYTEYHDCFNSLKGQKLSSLGSLQQSFDACVT